MKKYIFTIAILFFFILFIGCKEKPESLCPCGKVEINKKEYISMCIIPDIVSENSVNKLRMENHTKKDMMYDCFRIAYFNDGNWEPIQDSTICDKMARYVNAGEALEHEVNLYSDIDRFDCPQKGKYRISRLIGKYYLYAEFEIK